MARNQTINFDDGMAVVNQLASELKVSAYNFLRSYTKQSLVSDTEIDLSTSTHTYAKFHCFKNIPCNKQVVILN